MPGTSLIVRHPVRGRLPGGARSGRHTRAGELDCQKRVRVEGHRL